MNEVRRSSGGPGSWLLRAAWVYLYATLIAVFGLMRRIEGQDPSKTIGKLGPGGRQD